MELILERIAKLNEIKIEKEKMEVMPDNIHLLISFKPKYAPTNIVKVLKGVSAWLLFEKHPEIKRQSFWGGHLWSYSYYMSTLGDMSEESVECYIEDQRSSQAQKH